ncbi:hypothetical protein GCM10009081_29280 [Brevundimonas nasdae]
MSGSSLIQSLEAAEGGSRELDIAFGQALGIIDADLVYTAPDGSRIARGNCDPWPNWTTSLDAAVAVAERVLPDYEASVAQRKPRHGETCAEWWHASLFKVRTGVVFGSGPDTVSFKAKTPAQALCIAILRAKEGGQ